eukprot:m.24692 g.24692  ORF g.24692 m.24692 type:complete len:109 (-) comp14713_c1_seq1:191-517(-)
MPCNLLAPPIIFASFGFVNSKSASGSQQTHPNVNLCFFGLDVAGAHMKSIGSLGVNAVDLVNLKVDFSVKFVVVVVVAIGVVAIGGVAVETDAVGVVVVEDAMFDLAT